MTIQEHVVQVAAEAAGEFFRYASQVPPDKLDWKPLDEGQSVLSMCREIAMTPEWAYSVTADVAHDEEASKASLAAMQSWNSVDQCQGEFLLRFEKWAEFIRAFPTERLMEKKWLPFNGGRDHSYLEMLEYPRWNFTYHLGQVAYIQTLYGDKGMY